MGAPVCLVSISPSVLPFTHSSHTRYAGSVLGVWSYSWELDPILESVNEIRHVARGRYQPSVGSGPPQLKGSEKVLCGRWRLS